MGEIVLRLGRAGSGKSTQIAQEIATMIKADGFGAPIYWIVPSQAAYSTERLLLKYSDASIRAEVIHLNRFVERANRAIGAQSGAAINRMGRRMLLASVYHQVKSNLDVFHRLEPTLNFYDSVLQVFSEMTQHGISLEHLETALEVASAGVEEATTPVQIHAGKSLLGKLRDLCTLYFYWKREMRQRGLYDDEELISIVEERLDQWEQLGQATLYVDGFSEMSPQEISFILAAAHHAKKTVISLSVDEKWLLRSTEGHSFGREEAVVGSLNDRLSRINNSDEVYSPQSLMMVDTILNACDERGLLYQIEVPIHNSVRFADAPQLQLLEEKIFGGSVSDLEGDSLRLVAAESPRHEVDWCAEEILRAQKELNVPFHDIAVLTTDLETYRPYLRDRFVQYGIPFYAEEFPPLSTHPLPKFLLYTMECIRSDFQNDTMKTLVKSEFSGVSEDDADWFENYLISHEISGSNDWLSHEPWTFALDSKGERQTVEQCIKVDKRANEIRDHMMTYLRPCALLLQEEKLQPQSLARGLWTLIESTNAKRKVAQWMVNADVEQSPIEASIHEQAWQRVIELMNDLNEIEMEKELPTAFLFELVQGHLIQETLSSIPAGVDEVMVTDTKRAVGWDASLVFILGALDNKFPKRARNSSLLRDDERALFVRLFGRRLGSTAEDLQLSERLTVYSSLTRAKQRLYLCYPLSNTTGKKVSPAFVIQRVKTLFPKVLSTLYFPNIEASADIISGSCPVYTVRQAVEYVVLHLSRLGNKGSVPSVVLPLWDWLCQDEQLAKHLEKSLSGVRHQTGASSLPTALVQALYGTPMRTNVHQLEAFASCPYQHFAKFGLKVESAKQPDVTPALRGTLKHDVLLEFVQRQMNGIEDSKQWTDDEAVAVMREVFYETIELPQFALWSRKQSRREYANSVLRELESAAIVLTRHGRSGMFEPALIEFSFGDSPADEAPSFKVQLNDGTMVHLRGRIDRVDVVSIDGRHAFRIVDYKSSKMKIDLTKVASGLRLQLPLYAAVMERMSESIFGRTSEPAGMIYIPIVHKVELVDVPEPENAAQEAVYQNMRASGLFVEDKSLIEWMDSRLTSPPQKSDLFPQIYKQDGSPMQRAPILSKNEWQSLVGRAVVHIKEFSGRILSGEIGIEPFWMSSADHACTFCDFSALCHFDRKNDGGLFRRIQKVDRDTLTGWASYASEVVDHD